MQIRCPNCECSFAPEGASADERYACTRCGRLIYVDNQGLFPAVSAMTYPGAGMEAQALKSFFFIAEAQRPVELSRPALGTASLASTGSIAFTPQSEAPPVDDAPNEDLPTVAGEPVDAAPPEALASEDPPPPMPPSRSVDDFQPEAVGGGTFESALTPAPNGGPPPLRAGNLGGLMTPPWEQAGPPPLAKDESWHIAMPGTQAPAQKGDDGEEFAKALGLPSLETIAVHHEPSHPKHPSHEDEPPPKRSRAWLYASAATIILTAGGIFLGLRLQQKAPPPVVDLPPPPLAASQPDTPPAPHSVADDARAMQRAQALDHYNKGSKLYRDKKLPAAVEEFKKAIDADATFGLAHRGLGVAYASQSKAELAIKEYKAYLKVSPDAKDAKQVEQLVKNFEK